jgi:hypothetical protein
MEELLWYQHVGLWVAAILTLAIFSFLYKDNPVYKMAEHVFVGVAAGYTVAYAFWSTFIPNLYTPLATLFTGGEIAEGQTFWTWMLLIPAMLGLFFFARFHPKYGWLSRWSIAFLVGAYAGLNLTGKFQTDLILQPAATFVNLNPATGGWSSVFLVNLPILFGVLACLTYFFFSKPHTGFIGVSARTGIFFLMAAFGASFGYTVMARISLFIGRLQFLFWDVANQYTGWFPPPT